MNEDFRPPPYVYEGLDPDPKRKPLVSEVSDVMTSVAAWCSGAIESGRRPGMPLSVLSNVAREAPLGSLLAAFLLGIAVGRRR